MTILVTGAAGFVGFHTASALLARGETVVGIDSLNDYYSVALKQARLATLRAAHGDRFRFHQVDIAENDAVLTTLAGCDFDRIVHLAAQAGVRHSIEHPGDYVRANLVGHANMVELARRRGVRHLVYASSSSVYGGSTTLPFRVEDRADHQLSLYGATKRADELISESYASLYRLPATGLRFFTVYGPWGRPDMAMWLFADAILAGRPLTLFNHGAMSRDFTFVEDIVAGLIACLDHPPADDGSEKPGGSRATHAVYNIGNHRSEKLTEVVRLIEQSLGRRAEVQFAAMQPGDTADSFADIGPMQRDFGFAPRTTIAEGIPRFIDWFRDYHARVAAA